MSISRKIKRSVKKEPLSLLDKSIYVFLLLLAFALMIIIGVVFGITVPMSISFSDETIVAANNDAAILCALPLMFVIPLTIGVIASEGMHKKQPIFGNKSFKPSLLNPVLRMTPIFSENFKKELNIATKRKIKKYALIVGALIVISAIILPFGMCPRTTLDRNNVFSTYNAFNKQTHSADMSVAEKLIIDIYRSSGGRRSSPSCTIMLKFVFPDKTYEFRLADFFEMSKEEALKHMLNIKAMFEKGRYEITNTYLMKELISDRHFSAYETALAYELFEYNQGD